VILVKPLYVLANTQ